MRYGEMILVVALFTSLASSSIAAEETDDSPRRFIAEWAAAFNRNDAERISAFYDQSAELEVVISAGVRHRGYQAVRKAYADDLTRVRFYDSTVKHFSTRILGDTALVIFEHQFKTRFIEDDSRWRVHVRTTTVLQRMDGQWKIVLEHSSPIQGTDRVTPIQE